MRLPQHIRYLLRIYAVIVTVCVLFRLLLLGVVASAWSLNLGPWIDLLHALFIGWRFDTVVACYLLALPFLLLSLGHFLGARSDRWIQWADRFVLVIMLPVLFILAADIPWFMHNYARFSFSALHWMDNGSYMANLVIQERSFWIYLLPFIGAYAIAILGSRWAKRASATTHPVGSTSANSNSHIRVASISFIVSGCLIFLGMRGRVDEKSPIQVGTAYFGEDPFLNQLGLNPVFTFIVSTEKNLSSSRTPVSLMDAEAATWNAIHELGAEQGLMTSPIARRITPNAPMDSANVVIILLESMSTFKMGQYGGPAGLTPFLSALQKVSLNCDHAYSAGIHTFNGIYSTLYSFPALYQQQPLEDWLSLKHQGLARVLRANGYSTLFCTTHDPEFDNMKGFLLSQGFDRVISEDDYPDEWIASTNGIPDHRMFEYAVPELNALAKKGPFLSVFMTTSDHKPYILPDSLWFEPHSEKIEDRIVEYVDRSVARFFELSSKEPWYKNTVFVILGDHGVNMGHTYDMPLSFHHTPLIFHVPSGHISPGIVNSPCGQIDVAPTILGMLNITWTNTTMGIDITKQQRPFMYFCADDRIGCIDSVHYFIDRGNGHETLYRFADLSTVDLTKQFPEKSEAMKRYTYSMMQTTQWLVEHDLLDGGKAAANTSLP